MANVEPLLGCCCCRCVAMRLLLKSCLMHSIKLKAYALALMTKLLKAYALALMAKLLKAYALGVFSDGTTCICTSRVAFMLHLNIVVVIMLFC